MDIYDMTIDSGDDLFYSKSFMDTLETHLDFFRKSTSTRVVSVDAKKTAIYDGDLFGLLNELNVEQRYHWLIMRVNNFYSNYDFGPGITSLLIPSQTEIEIIRSSYISTGVMSL